MRFFTVFSLASLAVATSVDNKPQIYGNTVCKVVSKVLCLPGAASSATSFCSSYLKVPVVTSSQTSTSVISSTETVTTTYSTSTVTAPSVVVTSTATITEVSTVTPGTSTVTTTITSAITNCSPPNLKRGVGQVARPREFAAFPHGKILSSACKCVSVPTSTSTVTSTISTTSVVTSTSSVVPTTTTTETTTSTTTIISVITSFSTTSRTTTAPSATVTVQAVRQGPFAVVAQGGARNGQYAEIAPGRDGVLSTLLRATLSTASQFYINVDGQLASAASGATADFRCGTSGTIVW
ncbi:hypothetical protein BST61_g9767 [Cercospora zeina]